MSSTMKDLKAPGVVIPIKSLFDSLTWLLRREFFKNDSELLSDSLGDAFNYSHSTRYGFIP
jgi:hypothetical protein